MQKAITTHKMRSVWSDDYSLCMWRIVEWHIRATGMAGIQMHWGFQGWTAAIHSYVAMCIYGMQRLFGLVSSITTGTQLLLKEKSQMRVTTWEGPYVHMWCFIYGRCALLMIVEIMFNAYSVGFWRSYSLARWQQLSGLALQRCQRVLCVVCACECVFMFTLEGIVHHGKWELIGDMHQQRIHSTARRPILVNSMTSQTVLSQI